MNKLNVTVLVSGRRFLLLVALVAALFVADRASAGSAVQLSWPASTNSSTSGYKVYYGVATLAYTNAVDVGTNTSATISKLVPGTNYFFAITAYNSAHAESGFSAESVAITPPAAFFSGQQYMSNDVSYLQFPNGTPFGYCSVMNFPWVYHQDLGLVYFSDAGDATGGVYLKDSVTGVTWYTSPTVWPQMYDLSLRTWLYYYPNTAKPGHYSSAPRTFRNMTNGKNITR